MRAKKSLSQNFLKNESVARKVACAAGVGPDDTILEIGPGKGMLTRILLEQGAKVVAIEKDCELISLLEEKFSLEKEVGRFTLIIGDAVSEEILTEIDEYLPGVYKIAANIPYAITGQILRTFLGLRNPPERIGLLVQKEVAERIVATSKKESILSLSVKAYGDPKYIETVKRTNFAPIPKVDSAILAIENISKSFFNNLSEEDFFTLVKTGFRHKRKFLKSNLKNLPLNHSIHLDHLNDNVRAEELTLEQWGRILHV